jgi:hypothetical protein
VTRAASDRRFELGHERLFKRDLQRREQFFRGFQHQLRRLQQRLRLLGQQLRRNGQHVQWRLAGHRGQLLDVR